MIRAVLDVNVLVSAFPYRRGNPRQLINLWKTGAFELVISEHILAGTSRAWSNAYFRERFSAAPAMRAIAVLRHSATTVAPTADIYGVANDWEDHLVLATAVAGRTDYLVTGDNGLLCLGSFRDIRIVTPREFLSLLESETMSTQR